MNILKVIENATDQIGVAEKEVNQLVVTLYKLRDAVHKLDPNDDDAFNEINTLLTEIHRVQGVLQ